MTPQALGLPGVAAVLLAVGAVLLAWPRPAGVQRLRRARPTGRTRERWLLAILGLLALTAPLLLRPGAPAAAVAVGVLAVWGVIRLVGRARRAREAAVRREQVVDFGEALLGELRAGQPLARCLDRSSSTCPEAEAVAVAARLGADVPSALRRMAERRGAEGLLGLAAAWHLCAGLGSGLALAVERVVEGVRTDQATSRLVEGEVASAKATARLMATLPVLVLLAARGVGADPWRFLLTTGPGVACLAGGCLLLFAGLEWIDRIAEAALSGGP